MNNLMISEQRSISLDGVRTRRLDTGIKTEQAKSDLDVGMGHSEPSERRHEPESLSDVDPATSCFFAQRRGEPVPMA